MALSTQPYKGARDFYPEDERIQKFMFKTIRSVVERFGYEEYNAPILEPLEIYLAKTGDEIVNEQTYVFEDRGGRKVVIRPEMTPTVSRMVAARRQELVFPIRWYSIPNLWRYERPQKGRLREHWQLNVDIFGVQDYAAELEIITLVDAILAAFGSTHDMYEIRINSRKLMDFILGDYLGLNETEARSIAKLIDRMHKMEPDEFVRHADDIIDAAKKEAGAVEKLIQILNVDDVNKLPDQVKQHPSAVSVTAMLKSLKESGIDNVRFDITLMRGFDYYTDIVFEVFDNDPDNNRSMLGGGRYDGLVGLFGVEPVPTVGFGWGDVTLANYLRIHHLMPDLKTETQVYIVQIGEAKNQSNQEIKKLRAAGINVAVDFSERKIGDQIRTAQRKGIPTVMIIGPDELASKIYKLKFLDSGTEKSLDIVGIINELTLSR